MEPLTGDDPGEVAGYRLRARLGSGGMGRVYLACTPDGRAVALKMMHPELADDPQFRHRFEHEVAAARRVHGRYTAQVLAADPAATPPWLVTAYVPGPSLREAVTRDGPMPAETVLVLMARVAEALCAIHAAGVVHRDLKPSNVLLAPDGPRVIDFGISRAADTTALTRSGIQVGSPNYMAPEQVAELPVSGAADVFALGSLAAYAVLGRPSFGDGNAMAVMYRVLHQAADLTGCPPPLREIIERCLAKNAAERPTPAQIIGMCRAAGGLPPPGRRAPGRVLVLAGVVGLLLAAVGLHELGPGSTPPTPPTPATPPTSWLSGTWTGTADQPTGVVTRWTAELTFPEAGKAGTFRFPSLGCSGTLLVTRATPTTASVHEDLIRNPRRLCAPGGLLELTRSSADGLDMAWRDSSDRGNVATAHLEPRR